MKVIQTDAFGVQQLEAGENGGSRKHNLQPGLSHICISSRCRNAVKALVVKFGSLTKQPHLKAHLVTFLELLCAAWSASTDGAVVVTEMPIVQISFFSHEFLLNIFLRLSCRVVFCKNLNQIASKKNPPKPLKLQNSC